MAYEKSDVMRTVFLYLLSKWHRRYDDFWGTTEEETQAIVDRCQRTVIWSWQEKTDRYLKQMQEQAITEYKAVACPIERVLWQKETRTYNYDITTLLTLAAPRLSIGWFHGLGFVALSHSFGAPEATNDAFVWLLKKPEEEHVCLLFFCLERNEFTAELQAKEELSPQEQQEIGFRLLYAIFSSAKAILENTPDYLFGSGVENE